MIAVNGLEDGSISVSRFLHLLYLLPSLTCFLTYTSLTLSLIPVVLLFVTPSSPWFHHGNPSTQRLFLSLSLLMAQLLVLMHFKHTAAATSQSE